MDSFRLQHSGGPTVSESPANDLPPKYEDLLRVEQGRIVQKKVFLEN